MRRTPGQGHHPTAKIATTRAIVNTHSNSRKGTIMTLLQRLLEQRTALQSELEALLATVDTEARTELTDDETAKFTEKRAAIDALDDRIETESKAEERNAAHAARVARFAPAGPVATITSQERTYNPAGSHSFVADVVAARSGRSDALERLDRHTQEERSITTAPFDASGVAPGAYIVPTFLSDGALAVNRARTIYADGVTNLALPGGVSSFEVPRLTAGAVADEQAGELQPLVEGALAADMVSTRVRTYGGNQVISLQATLQSSVAWDQIVLRDLAAVTGSKVNQGALTAALASATRVDAPGATIGDVFSAVVGAGSTILTNRFDAASRIVMSPRRWAFCLSATDTTGRPLVNAYAPSNAIGTGSLGAGGPVGELAGLPVYVEPFLSANVGGTGRDIVLVEKADDVILWKSPIFTRAIDSTEWADSLGILLQAYQFAAVLATRTADANGLNATGAVALHLTGLPA